MADQFDPTKTILTTPTDWQQIAFSWPWSADWFVGGTRAVGKTEFALARCAQYAVSHPGARTLIFRQTEKPLKQHLIPRSMILYPLLDPRADFKVGPMTWTFSNGSTIEFQSMHDPQQISRLHGSEYAAYYIDEAAQFAEPDTLIDLLLGGLRQPGYPHWVGMSANPFDVGAGWIFQRLVANYPGDPRFSFLSGELARKSYAYLSTSIADNPHVDPEYIATLRQACANNPSKMAAWLHGEWSITGNFFGDAFELQRNTVKWLPPRQDYWSHSNQWRRFIALDWGTASPAWCGLFAIARENGAEGLNFENYEKGDVILLDSVDTGLDDRPDRGDRSTVTEFSKRVCDLCFEWQTRPSGVGDSAVFAEHGSEMTSLGAEFNDNRVHIEPSEKGPRSRGWDTLRNRLALAQLLGHRSRESAGGLYVNIAQGRNQFFLNELRSAVPDPRNPEDLGGNRDHSLDAARYALAHIKNLGYFTITELAR